ncbi:MAG: hypothetical protein KGQ42_05010 [Alphaproteobacteria bacterium]|nr:hypothetical protein [Alphaproteobacteria bacterium]MDE2041710.1 hypothetical protein [Alphaproteobacteria bacterium]MDE2341233.1 hypothetical protein [Alphaproteobacteria bacterium]
MRHLILAAAALALALAVSITPVLAADNAPAPAMAPAAAKPYYTTTDTDIGTLIDTPATRVIVDKYLPGLSTNDQIAMARPMTLRAVQQFAPDKITTDNLDKIDADLAKVPAPKP